jgi:hypothetical protein
MQRVHYEERHKHAYDDGEEGVIRGYEIHREPDLEAYH